MLGSNGGAAFLAVYIICVLILGMPVMLTEFFIGRYSRSNAARAFTTLAPGTRWNLIGYNGVLVAFFILGFYSVVAGWTLEYIWQSAQGALANKTTAEFKQVFEVFSSSAIRPIICTVVFVLFTHSIIASGVKGGIERASKIMMPILFFMLIVLCVRSVTLPNASEGLKFLLKPDFSKVTSSVVLSAMGQAFFSLSVGMGTLITYASYFKKDTNMQFTAFQVTILDTFVALLAGIMIFPAVFSFGLAPTAGPELVFITLPNVFEQLPFGSVWSTVFFILLAVAALTSTISLHEVPTAYLHEEFNISRKKASILVSLGVIVLGVISSLSFGTLKSFTIFGMSFFDFLDYITAKIMMPLGGMMLCIFVGTRIKKNILETELTNQGSITFHFFNVYVFVVRWIAPILIGLIFLNELGLLDWIK
jgi:NSS family neurotransmitter:Na+ symporter